MSGNRTTLHEQGAALEGRTIRFVASTPHYRGDHLELTVDSYEDISTPGGPRSAQVVGSHPSLPGQRVKIGLPRDTQIEFIDDVDPVAQS